MMGRVWFDKIEKTMISAVGILMAAVLILAATASNGVYKGRQDGNYRLLENAVCTQIQKADAPTGMVRQYRFRLEQIHRADMLAFYLNHHNIEVFLDGECVYSVSASGRIFRTTGGIWTMIPLDESDSGKEVQILLSPLYSTYQDEEPDIFIGSELEIYRAAFTKALPELILSLCVALAGLFLLCLAGYHTIKHSAVPQLYAVGLLSLFAGIWRFSYGQFAYLLFEKHSILIYNLSVISLMVIALAMLGCLEVQKPWKAIVRYCFVGYCVTYLVVLALQCLGVLDLRQMLQAIHITLIVSAVALFISSVGAQMGKEKTGGVFLRRNHCWMLGIGVLADLLLYYFAENSAGMLFTLGAILCFSLLEGIKLLLRFAQQENELEALQTQLVLSRTTTMMSQIRSHFVFNILNAISGMCKYDPEKADDTVVRFSRYLRNNIDIMEKDENIPFTTILQELEDYVVLEQVRFGDKIEFYTDIEADQFELPPLILQPVVENAIKHGVSKKLTDGTIILRTRDGGDHIVITVEDDGVGFNMKELDKEKSVGLRNIRFRLEHLVNGRLDIASREGEGTTVTITIPKKETKG